MRMSCCRRRRSPRRAGTFTNTDRRVQIGRPVIAPPGDARQDWWIIQEIARRLGLDWNYSGPADVFAEMAMTMPSFNNITWERLEREGAVTYPVDGPDEPGNDIIFADGFPTENGRAKIVPANIRPPDEVPDMEYPMVLSTGRVLEHWHTGSMTRRAGVLDELEPEAVAFLAPRELHRLDLQPGGKTAAGDAPRSGRAQCPRGQGRAGWHGVHAVLLRGGGRQSADQSGAGSGGQDSGVQVLRGARVARAGGGRGRLKRPPAAPVYLDVVSVRGTRLWLAMMACPFSDRRNSATRRASG